MRREALGRHRRADRGRRAGRARDPGAVGRRAGRGRRCRNAAARRLRHVDDRAGRRRVRDTGRRDRGRRRRHDRRRPRLDPPPGRLHAIRGRRRALDRTPRRGWDDARRLPLHPAVPARRVRACRRPRCRAVRAGPRALPLPRQPGGRAGRGRMATGDRRVARRRRRRRGDPLAREQDRPARIDDAVRAEGLAAALLVGALALAGGAVWLGRRLWHVPPVLEAATPRDERPPLERALELALAESGNGASAPDRRRALERVARELDAVGLDDLADEARELAWSPRASSPDEVESLARRAQGAAAHGVEASV